MKPDAAETWVIEPRARNLRRQLGEVWRARALAVYFAHRAAESIVKNTLLGYLWLVLRPGLPLAVLTVVFGFVVRVQPDVQAPYVVFLLLGMTAWSAFEAPVLWGTRGLYINRSLLSKIYFPRIIVPVASTFPGQMDFVVHAGFLAFAIAFFFVSRGELHLHVGWPMAVAIGALLLAFLLAVAVSLFTSLWDYRARDTRYTLSVLLRFGLYISPVIYPSSSVPAEFRVLYFANPLAGIIEAFRYGILGEAAKIPSVALGYSAVFTIVALGLGVVYFTMTEADTIDRG